MDDSLKKLGELMVRHGAVIRAIPRTVKMTVGVGYAEKYPDRNRPMAEIVYSSSLGRKVLVCTRTPENAGKFAVVFEKGTGATVNFRQGGRPELRLTRRRHGDARIPGCRTGPERRNDSSRLWFLSTPVKN